MHDALTEFKQVIVGNLGRAPDHIEPGKLQRFATSDKRGDLAGWCKLFADLRGGVFGCNRQGISETWQAERDQPMTRQQRIEQARQVEVATIERERQQRQQWAENAQRIGALWAECVPLVSGDPVTLYLKRRGLGGLWPLPPCLRYHPALPYWQDGVKLGDFPAMVAPLMTPTGRMVALHRTFLTRDGRKAEVATPKKLTATAGPLGGACIPLCVPQDGVIGIAEGIETALAAWCASAVPTVAAYSAGSLAAWQWPPGVRRIVIFGDNDRAGIEAAEALKARALAAGLACECMTPSADRADWCDVWAQREVADDADEGGAA